MESPKIDIGITSENHTWATSMAPVRPVAEYAQEAGTAVLVQSVFFYN